MEKTNSFDSLVSGLSGEERKSLLRKVRSSTAQASADEEQDEGYASYSDMRARLAAEPFYVRFWIWLKSVISSTPAQGVYNQYTLNSIARKVEREFPDLIDHRKGQFLSGFYIKLSQLRNSANFFRRYVSYGSGDSDLLYDKLSSAIVPELEERIREEADPYTLPLDRDPAPDARSILLRKLDDIMQEMDESKRAEMYAAVRGFEWLRQIMRLPLDSFVTSFSSTSGQDYSCRFDLVSSKDFLAQMARTLSAAQPLPKELMSAMRDCAGQAESASKNLEEAEQEEEDDFFSKADSHAMMINMFVKSVPLRSIGKVVYADASWNAEPFGGGEDWFVKFKAQWKKNFDRRWRAWSADAKREKIRSMTQQFYGMRSLPLLPNRPWALLWGGLPFRYEYTMGFILSFLQNQYAQSYVPAIKTLSLEGEFIKKDNQSELTDVSSAFASMAQGLSELNEDFSPSGESGAQLAALKAERLRTNKSQALAEQIMGGLEESSKRVVARFCDSCRHIVTILAAILGEKTDDTHAGISNLSSIKGRENAKFRSSIADARAGFMQAVAIVSELEAADAPIPR